MHTDTESEECLGCMSYIPSGPTKGCGYSSEITTEKGEIIQCPCSICIVKVLCKDSACLTRLSYFVLENLENYKTWKEKRNA